MNVHFVLRTNYVNKQGLQQVQLIYCSNNQQVRLDTGVRIRPKDWNEPKQQILASVTEIGSVSKELTDQLIEKRKKVFTIVSDYKKANESGTSIAPDPNPKFVHQQFYEVRKEIRKERPLLEHLKEYIEQRKDTLDVVYDGLNKDKRNGQYKTLSHFEVLYNDLVRFSTKTKKTYYFKDVDKKFKNLLINFYLDKGAKKEDKKKGLSNSTLKKKFTKLKSFLAEMTEDGVNKKLDYQAFSLKSFKVADNDDNIYCLTFREFNQFMKEPIKLPKLEIARDYYLLASATGLRWSDVSRLNRNKVKDRQITTTIVKTKKSVTIPLNPISESILIKYDYQLPQISKTEIDRRLKLMWITMCKAIPSLKQPTSYKYFIGSAMVEETYPKHELLTFHTSRKYFISYLVHNNVPLDQIKKFTGHSGKSLDVFFRYVYAGNFNPEEHKNLFTESNLWTE